MPRNIKKIAIDTNNPHATNGVPVVKIEFNFPCTWTIFNIEDLKQILREWIKGEEIRYPQSEGYRGRWLLFDEIKRVFDE